jgi:hypothetical protein
MTPEQEIRAKAIELKLNGTTRMAAACIQKGIPFDGSGLWADNDLEEICEYITTGKKTVIKE